MKYRADIDGLRALAVLPIILFHAGVSELPGGFVGVDIFFVISGFLITGIIARELDSGRFSLLDFYRRRIIRIFPALFVMLFAVLAWGCLRLLPNELAPAGKSAAATAFFVSNIYFWQTTNYFSNLADLQPLLHTWSLGVEEQFYLFYPLLLLLIARFARRQRKLALAAVAIVSFGLCLALRSRGTVAPFYLFPPRAWELAIGGLVALGAMPSVVSGAWRSRLAALGLGMIVVGVLTISPALWFPAPVALLPCGGAALLIAYGRGAMTERLLVLPPLRWIGALSYSLYLWHWPIIVLYRLEHGLTLHWDDTMLLVAASFLAATLSFFLVEQPTRKYFHRARAKPTMWVGAIGITAMAGLALGVSANTAGWHSIDPTIKRIASFASYDSRDQFGITCFGVGPYDVPLDRCLTFSRDKANVLLIGDSHAAQFWRALVERFPDRNIMQVNVASCRPIFRSGTDSRCNSFMQRAFAAAVANGGLNRIVLAGNWEVGDLDQLDAVLAYLRRHRIPATVIGPVVEYEGVFPNLLARSMLRNDPELMATFRDPIHWRLDRQMEARLKNTGITYVSMRDAECPRGHCVMLAADGTPIHFDYGHVTFSGARLLMRAVPRL